MILIKKIEKKIKNYLEEHSCWVHFLLVTEHNNKDCLIGQSPYEFSQFIQFSVFSELQSSNLLATSIFLHNVNEVPALNTQTPSTNWANNNY